MPLTEQISHFCSITSCILLVKAPLNHLMLLLPVLHPHHYKRYMRTAFAFTTAYLWRSGLIPYRPFPFGTVTFVVHVKGACDSSTGFCSVWIIWIAARDCRSTLRVVTSLKNLKAVVFACYCCPKWGTRVWKQLPWAANWIFPDDPRNLPPCSSTERYLVNKRPYIGLCGQS